MCSPRLAVFRWRGTPGAKHEGPPALPIPRLLNQTSALGLAAAASAGPGEPDNIETSLDRRQLNTARSIRATNRNETLPCSWVLSVQSIKACNLESSNSPSPCSQPPLVPQAWHRWRQFVFLNPGHLYLSFENGALKSKAECRNRVQEKTKFGTKMISGCLNSKRGLLLS